MKISGISCIVVIVTTALTFLNTMSVAAVTGDPESLLRQLDESPNTRQVAFSSKEVVDHEIGLGAIQKVRGVWRFKHSERLSGTLISYTWQIGNGYRAAEVMAQLLDSVAAIEGASMLFSCDGRACGRAVEWANRVFEQRVLFGREDKQLYRVVSLEGAHAARLIVYSGERTADRQYLHAELFLIAPE